MKLSIIIPAYNEEKRIGETLDAYLESSRDLKDMGVKLCDLLIVVNNSTDGTLEKVKKIAKKDRRVKFMNLERGGKGYAVSQGFKKALDDKYDLVGFVDADMATSPEEFFKLIKSMDNYDGAIASKGLEGAVILPRLTIQRKLARWLFNSVIRAFLFLPYKDTQCGAKVFTRKALEYVAPRLTMSKWAFDVDLLYLCKKGNFKIKEIPTVWIDKREYSKINFWSDGPWMAMGIARIRLINSPFGFSVRFYDRVLNKIWRRFK